MIALIISGAAFVAIIAALSVRLGALELHLEWLRDDDEA